MSGIVSQGAQARELENEYDDSGQRNSRDPNYIPMTETQQMQLGDVVNGRMVTTASIRRNQGDAMIEQHQHTRQRTMEALARGHLTNLPTHPRHRPVATNASLVRSLRAVQFEAMAFNTKKAYEPKEEEFKQFMDYTGRFISDPAERRRVDSYKAYNFMFYQAFRELFDLKKCNRMKKDGLHFDKELYESILDRFDPDRGGTPGEPNKGQQDLCIISISSNPV